MFHEELQATMWGAFRHGTLSQVENRFRKLALWVLGRRAQCWSRVQGTLGASDLLKTITTCSMILHAGSQLKLHPDVSELAEHVKG